MRFNETLYSNTVYAAPQYIKFRADREINVWKYCDRAVVRELDQLRMEKPIVVALDNRKLRPYIDYVIRENRIVFKRRLMPWMNRERQPILGWIFGHLWPASKPRRYYLTVIGEHKYEKKNNYNDLY